jgi:pimeloyl-ACP methyl ester carboxylesterase
VRREILQHIDLELWQQHSDIFYHNSLPIFTKDSLVEDAGAADKPVLLLIHGFPTASIDWQPVWETVCKTFRCVTLDLLGYGLSAKPLNQPITIMEQAVICRALLAQKSIKHAHILCHDYGVSVGQELLAGVEDKETFTPLSCIFLNGGLFPGVHRPRLIQKLLMSPIGPLVAKLTSFKKFANTMDEICTQSLSQQELDIYWHLLMRDNGRKILPALIRYMAERKIHGKRWGKATDNPPCPAILINGVDDPISGGHLVDAYEKRVTHPQTVRLNETGHYPQVEAPEKVLQAANDFWTMNSIHIIN